MALYETSFTASCSYKLALLVKQFSVQFQAVYDIRNDHVLLIVFYLTLKLMLHILQYRPSLHNECTQIYVCMFVVCSNTIHYIIF